jgi:hypothetical protein
MPHQESLTVIASIAPDHVAPIKAELGSISQRENTEEQPLPFSRLSNLHFARLFVLDGLEDLAGRPLPASLVYLANVDAPGDHHFAELIQIDPEAVDRVFGRCVGYPPASARTPATRLVFLQARSAPSQVFYVNRQGRSVRQIRDEDQLRRAIDGFLDSRDFTGKSAADVREGILGHVQASPAMRWAMQPPEVPDPDWSRRERWHAIGGAALAIVAAPLFLALLPVFLLLLYLHERRDLPDTSAAPDETIRALRDDEDFGIQNQVIAAGIFKPGPFRKLTSRGILLLADYAVRHVYNRGTLSGLNTIHFARWVSVHDGAGLFFSSNYDGSLESYMNDFIDKAAWGLNAIFSNGDGFPRTSFLFCGGIMDELAYKRFLPTRQVRSQVWYSAYPHLSTKNIANNAEIRLGLSAAMDDAATSAWLRRFGCGNQLPAAGPVARQLDRVPWHKLCRSPTS